MKTRRWKAGMARAVAFVLLALFCFVPASAAPKYKVLHAFGKGKDGGGLWSPVTIDEGGSLYGATSGGGAYNGGIAFRLSPYPGDRWTEDILHSFPSSPGDGAWPNGGLVQGRPGDWYGTSHAGGAYASGTVFQLFHSSGGWKESALYSFGEQHHDDGGDPLAGPVMDAEGNLYGTTDATAFEVSPGTDGSPWEETILHRFRVKKDDGADPDAGLILDASGNLYGTTEAGGIGCAGDGCGTVYELSLDSAGKWKETILHRFDNNGQDGYTPGSGALFMDSQGQLYGTTEAGGADGAQSQGTIYQLTEGADGAWNESILYSFKYGSSTGYSPAGGVIMDKYGNLYGTTASGGVPGCGVVYKLAPGPKDSWRYTVLHTFGYGTDGCMPTANLILDDKGNLYGTTALGGAYGAGIVFELTP